MAALLDDLAAETAALVELVEGLDDGGWDTPTPAEGWSVRDQIGHLAFFDDAALQAVRDPAAFQVAADAALRGESDPLSEHLRRARQLAGHGVLAWWRGARSALADAVATLDPRHRVPWYGPSMSVRTLVTARLMETWAHGQDVADALGVLRAPTARLRHVAHLGNATRSFSFAVRGMPVPDEEVRVELEGPAGERWSWGPEDAADRVQGSALEFCLVVTQRRNIADTALEVRGPLARQWMTIAQAYAGPPGPGRPPSGTSSPPRLRRGD